jgi:predicted naringenin-chalcone synthase
MQTIYRLPEAEQRKLAFLYRHSGIAYRYSVIPDYSSPREHWTFLPAAENGSYPMMEERMRLYQEEALPLSLTAIGACLEGKIPPSEITHLITVSCTGMSAPGLDLQIAEALRLPHHVFRTSVNFMGCYAAIHALKIAHLICSASPEANVLIVDTELCTIHFQHEYSADNAASSLLFGDGSAAVLLSNNTSADRAIQLDQFYSQVALRGKQDMAWELSSKGFLMTLSSYVPQLIKEDISPLVQQALQYSGLSQEAITCWCVHPGGKKILDAIETQLHLPPDALNCSRSMLEQYGNLSSASVLFILKGMMENRSKKGPVFGVAFGPGLTMETFTGTLL